MRRLPAYLAALLLCAGAAASVFFLCVGAKRLSPWLNRLLGGCSLLLALLMSLYLAMTLLLLGGI